MSILVEKQSGYQDKDDLKERIHKLIQHAILLKQKIKRWLQQQPLVLNENNKTH